MPILSVRHVTTYRYRQAVQFGEHRMMFRPRDSYDQRLLESRLDITPRPGSVRWTHDVFGNCLTLVRFASRAKELRFESTIRLDHSPNQPLDFETSENARTYPFSYTSEDMPDLLRSIERAYPDPQGQLDRWARRFVRRDGPIGTHDLLAEMTATIRREFTYVARHEAGTQAPARTLKLGRGTCRDFAVLMMEAARTLGFAARFVSGYLYSPPRAGADARHGGGNTHAWVRIFLPGAGWVEYDPTNGIVGNRDLIRVAVSRDPAQAVPLSGTWIGFPADYEGMEVTVDVAAEPMAPGSGAAAPDAAEPEGSGLLSEPIVAHF